MTLEGSIRRLHAFLAGSFPFSWQIVIADNASTDGTLAIARRLSYSLDGVEVIHLAQKDGGGRSGARGPTPTPACSATWTSTSRPTSPGCCRWSRRCCRVTATWRSAPGCPPGSSPARLQARADLAQLQPAVAACPPCSFQRCAMWVQGDPCRHRSRAARRGAGRGLVLRYRAPRRCAAARAADPRGAGRLGRRHRLAGRHPRHRARRPARRRTAALRRPSDRLTWVSPRRPMLAP